MRPKLLLLDLDGTVYAGLAPIDGAAETIAAAKAAGMRVLFVTNRANRTPEVVCDQLRGMGVDCEPSEVLTTAQVSARAVRGESVYVIGEEALESAVREVGATIVPADAPRADAVIVGLDRGCTYAKLDAAARFIGGGARFLATNIDPSLVLTDHRAPGTGALVAAVAAGVGHGPVASYGKPEPYLFNEALAMCGVRAEEALAIGDNLLTDIPAAVAAGIPSVLILTGYSHREDIAASPAKPTYVCDAWNDVRKLLKLR